MVGALTRHNPTATGVGAREAYIQSGRKILMHMRGDRLKGSTHACASCKHVVDRVALVSLSTVW